MARPRNKAKTEQRERRIKALIYGPPKHGKTHFLGTAGFDERTAPMALLDFEGGVLDVLEDMPGFGTDVVRIPVTTYDEMNEAYERVRSNDEEFKSVGIDSLSEVHIFMLMSQLEDGKASREKEPDLIQQGDYGVGLVQLRRFVREFRDLPLHVFYTAHHREEVDRKEGLVTIPSMAGKAATEIPGLMTVVGYLALSEGEDEVQRVLLLQNYAKIRIGVRTGWGNKPPDEIEDPTVTALLDALKY